jgi:hypothetical protein
MWNSQGSFTCEFLGFRNSEVEVSILLGWTLLCEVIRVRRFEIGRWSRLHESKCP